MRQTVTGGLIAVLTFIVGLLGDRVVANAPEWLWPFVAAFGATLASVIVLTAEPVRTRLAGIPGGPKVATLIAFLICGAVGAAAWAVMTRLESAPAPPLYVTRVEVFPPSEVGQPVMTRVHVFSKRTGNVIRARGGALIFPEWSAEDERRRAEIEFQDVWQMLVDGRGTGPSPEPITLPEGEYSLDAFPFLLAPEHLRGLTGGMAAVYVFGQFDYGNGMLDYCYRWRPDGSVKPCLSHNGPTLERVF